MTWTKLLIVMTLLSVGSAALVGFVSRTPASVREDVAGPDSLDPARGSSFTDAEISRAGDFRGPAYLGFVLTTLIPIVLLLQLARGPFAELVGKVGGVKGGWPIQALIVAASIAVLTSLFLLPVSVVRGYYAAKAWGLSTQDLPGWLTDQARGLLIGTVMAGVSAIAFFGVVRAAPRTWWLWGWAIFTMLTALLVFLYPVAIAPLFNKFTSLEEGPLRTRILQLGNEAEVPLEDVLIADASKRTTAENAYVAGLGATKQMVLYDTLLRNGDEDDTVFIVAHELGHKIENDVLKYVAYSSIGLFVGFAALYLLAGRTDILGWGGAADISDLRALPLLLLYLSFATLLTLPIQNAISRSAERRADEIAIELTGDPTPGIKAFRRLAFSNIADLRPHPIAEWMLFTHPPIPDRLEALVRHSD